MNIEKSPGAEYTPLLQSKWTSKKLCIVYCKKTLMYTHTDSYMALRALKKVTDKSTFTSD